ncbi:MAG: CPBP family intramembrane metalloprotease [Oscillospiraceae bacterium]|nr:CPBP family intramembrane metalloprotease [Oscillospiraceae bacterium]
MEKISVTLTHKEKMLGWIYYPLQLLIIPLVISLVNALIGYPMNEAVLNFVYFAVNFVCILLIGFRFLKNNAKNALKAPLRCISSAVIGLFFYWGLSYIIQIFIMIIDPTFFNVNDASIDNMIQENSTLMTVGIVLLVPIAEEFLYRGLFFSQFYNRKPIAAYLISTCIFAAIHVVGYAFDYPMLRLVLCFLQYLPAGIAMGWAYARADSIWASILMHTAINLIGALAMR